LMHARYRLATLASSLKPSVMFTSMYDIHGGGAMSPASDYTWEYIGHHMS
jgi:hypothetical protein